MCGIFAYLGSLNASQVVFQGLCDLEYRGYDSWGITALAGHILKTQKNIGKLAGQQLTLPSSHLALGHTRWATHGGVTQLNSHPHLDCGQTLSLVHNGIVENYQALKSELLAADHHFISDTDSEVIVHLIESYLAHHSFADAVRLAFARLEGLNAIVVLDQASSSLVAFRHGSPLTLGRDQAGGLYLSSDLPSLSRYAHEFIPLEDNQGVFLSSKQATLLDLATTVQSSLTFQPFALSSTKQALGKYPHYLLKEISEQAEVVTHLSKLPFSNYHALSDKLQATPNLILSACGSALFACQLGAYYFAINLHKSSYVYDASEAALFLSQHNSGYHLSLSQSGETIDTIEAVKIAQQQGFNTGSLVNVVGSTLSRLTTDFLPLCAGPEQAVLSTKAYTAMLASLYLLSQPTQAAFTHAQSALERASTTITGLLGLREEYQQLAHSLLPHEHLFVIGRGLNYPTALEGALKLKESSYIHAEGMAAGMLKHGTIALIEEGTPVIALIPADKTQKDMLSNAMEVKARGAYVIGLSPISDPCFDVWIKVDDLGDLSPLANIVPLQLIAYELTLLRGHDPDKPRNLAKSVTVK